MFDIIRWRGGRQSRIRHTGLRRRGERYNGREGRKEKNSEHAKSSYPKIRRTMPRSAGSFADHLILIESKSGSAPAPAATAVGTEHNAAAGNMDANALIIAMTIAMPLVAPPIMMPAVAVAIAAVMHILYKTVRRSELIEDWIVHTSLRRRRCERHCGRDRGRRQYQSSFHPLHSCFFTPSHE
jgi:hypothetical protein